MPGFTCSLSVVSFCLLSASLSSLQQPCLCFLTSGKKTRFKIFPGVHNVERKMWLPQQLHQCVIVVTAPYCPLRYRFPLHSHKHVLYMKAHTLAPYACPSSLHYLSFLMVELWRVVWMCVCMCVWACVCVCVPFDSGFSETSHWFCHLSSHLILCLHIWQIQWHIQLNTHTHTHTHTYPPSTHTHGCLPVEYIPVHS